MGDLKSCVNKLIKSHWMKWSLLILLLVAVHKCLNVYPLPALSNWVLYQVKNWGGPIKHQVFSIFLNRPFWSQSSSLGKVFNIFFRRVNVSRFKIVKYLLFQIRTALWKAYCNKIGEMWKGYLRCCWVVLRFVQPSSNLLLLDCQVNVLEM